MHSREEGEKIEATHSCGINGIAEKKGWAGYHFNRTVRVQWFFLVIFIWGFYVCASWFKGTLNHWGWGVVDYAFNQVAGLGKVAGRITRASAEGPITLWLSWKEPYYFHLPMRWNKRTLYLTERGCCIFRFSAWFPAFLHAYAIPCLDKEWNWTDHLVHKISWKARFVLKKLSEFWMQDAQ